MTMIQPEPAAAADALAATRGRKRRDDVPAAPPAAPPEADALADLWGDVRSKTVTWHDPMPIAAAAMTMSGREFLQAMADGRIPPPPIARMFDFRPVSLGAGEAVFTCTPGESAYNPLGIVHGGLVCTLLDTVTACAVQTTLPAGVGLTSIEIKVNYLRPIRLDGERAPELTARGWVTKPGRRVSFAEGDVRGAHGKVVATASSTCLLLPVD